LSERFGGAGVPPAGHRRYHREALKSVRLENLQIIRRAVKVQVYEWFKILPAVKKECGGDKGCRFSDGLEANFMKYFAMTAVFAWMLFSAAVSPMDLYVATNGNDANPGTQSAPLATITKASQLAVPGTTVHVMEGRYNESVATKASGTAALRITYISNTERGAIIVGQGFWAWNNTGDYSDVTGFQITGQNSCVGLGLGGSFQGAYKNIVFNPATGCEGDAGGAGINSYNYAAQGNIIRNNNVHDVGRGNSNCGPGPGQYDGIHGIYVSNLGADIEYNFISHSCGFNIHLWHAASHATISHNTSILAGDSGILVGSGDKPCSTDVGCPGGDDYTTVSFNILSGNARGGIYEFSSDKGSIGSHNIYKNNISYQQGMKDWAINGKPCTDCVVGVDPFQFGERQGQ
jgi:hypothetical protein